MLRLRKPTPTTHKDFSIVDWKDEDYDYIIRHFGGAPHNNNGNGEKSALRIGRVLTHPEDAITGNPHGGTWWKIRGGNRTAFESIDFGVLVALSTCRILKDTLIMLYNIQNAKT